MVSFYKINFFGVSIERNGFRDGISMRVSHYTRFLSIFLSCCSPIPHSPTSSPFCFMSHVFHCHFKNGGGGWTCMCVSLCTFLCENMHVEATGWVGCLPRSLSTLSLIRALSLRLESINMLSDWQAEWEKNKWERQLRGWAGRASRSSTEESEMML